MTEHTPASSSRLRTGATERYCDELLLALRMREVPGDRIGAVLAEVRDHLDNSAEDPVETFGPPEDYAAALTANGPAAPRPARWRDWARNTVGVAGIMWAAEGGTALLSGKQATLTEFQVLLPAAIAFAGPYLISAVVKARRAALAGWTLLVTLLVAGAALLHAWVGPLISLQVPPAALLVPGLLVVMVGIITSIRAVDPVLDPLDDAASVRRRRRDGVRFTSLMSLLLLLLLVVPVVLSVLLQHPN